jgi:putative tricarboxylic transport membrane protein
VASVIAGLMFYVLAAEKLGFHIVGMALLTLWIRVLGGSWRVAVAVGVVGTLVIHLSFYKLLRIPLPWGLFERYAF